MLHRNQRNCWNEIKSDYDRLISSGIRKIWKWTFLTKYGFLTYTNLYMFQKAVHRISAIHLIGIWVQVFIALWILKLMHGKMVEDIPEIKHFKRPFISTVIAKQCLVHKATICCPFVWQQRIVQNRIRLQMRQIIACIHWENYVHVFATSTAGKSKNQTWPVSFIWSFPSHHQVKLLDVVG